MQHIPHDDLALRAASRVEGVGELDEHLLTCAQCADELASLQQTVARVRAESVEPVPLPAGLWERIAAEVADDERAATVAAVPAPPSGGRDERVAPGDAGLASGAADATGPEATPGSGTPAHPRESLGAQASTRGARRRRLARFSSRALVAACLVTALVIAGGVALGTWIAQRPPAETVLASIALDPLADGLDGASARIVERDGHRVLEIDTGGLPSADGGYLDVWLIDADVEGMVNVGILDGVTGEYVLPDDLDLERFPIVDVSIEPLDGDPTHSGESVWRGSLA
ncbi:MULTISPECIES: anti-sigma factor domain-containing protein [unclassified Agrococcus]|uniref:anti-sigma factor n=1 Tax=unclassified Agrococcus TaxID=2615065 RepID=UPI003609FDB1